MPRFVFCFPNPYSWIQVASNKDGAKPAEEKKTKENPMLKLHWDAISADKVSENSVWSTTPKQHNLDNDERKELENLFAAKPSAGAPKAPVTPRVSLRLLVNTWIVVLS